MVQGRGYQFHLSCGNPVFKDVEGRTQKFEKIISVLRNFHSGGQSVYCLDIGCSNGIITSSLADYFAITIPIDIDQEAIQYAESQYSSPHVHFLFGDAMPIPFKENSIDIVVCNHIYEHVPQVERLMVETRILREEGCCYFSAGNKYVLIERHYQLPFLSWIPKSIAHFYIRLVGKGDFYHEEHRSLRGLRQLVKRFQIHDFTIPIIQNPQNFLQPI